MLFSIIPRRPESTLFRSLLIPWTPVFTGVTTFYEALNLPVTKNCLDSKELFDPGEKPVGGLNLEAFDGARISKSHP
jgi:hypothetical protein